MTRTYTKRGQIDEKLKKILVTHQKKDGWVYIQRNTSEYEYLKTAASREGKTIRDLVTSYGYIYDNCNRVVSSIHEFSCRNGNIQLDYMIINGKILKNQTIKELKVIVNKYINLETGQVYVPVGTKDYQTIISVNHRKGISPKELIEIIKAKEI